MNNPPGLIQKSTCELVDLLDREEITLLDLLDALEPRVTEVDGSVPTF